MPTPILVLQTGTSVQNLSIIWDSAVVDEIRTFYNLSSRSLGEKKKSPVLYSFLEQFVNNTQQRIFMLLVYSCQFFPQLWGKFFSFLSPLWLHHSSLNLHTVIPSTMLFTLSKPTSLQWRPNDHSGQTLMSPGMLCWI